MPYTLGQLDIGADALARGISGGAQALAGGITGGIDRRDRRTREQQMMDYYRERDAKADARALRDDTRQERALQFQMDEAGQRRAMEQEDRARIGQSMDLGEGYRGVLTGPRSLSIIAPEEKPFVPDPATVEELKRTGHMFMPLSRSGAGTVVPTRRGEAASVPPLVESGGYYFDGNSWKQRTGASKPLDAADAATLQAGTTELERIKTELAEQQAAIAKGENRYGFLNLSNRHDRVAELLAQQKGLETKLGAMRGPARAPAASSDMGGAPRVLSPAGPAAAAPAPAASAPPSDAGEVLAQARSAIQRGAPREKVIERLREKGYPTEGL